MTLLKENVYVENVCLLRITKKPICILYAVKCQERFKIGYSANKLILLSLLARELDMDVFNTLHVGLITKAALDSDMNTKVRYNNMLNSDKSVIHQITFD